MSTRSLRPFFRNIFNDWPAKIVALALAIILYFIVGLTGVEERYITVPIRVMLPENFVAGEEYSRFVRVYLRGEPDDIFSIAEDEIPVTADFSPFSQPGIFRAALSHTRLGISANLGSLEVRLDPDILTLTLEEKRVVEVDIVPAIINEPSAGFELTSYSVIPPRTRIFGPLSVVEEFREIRTEPIDLSRQSSSFSNRISLLRPHPLIGFEDTALVEFRAEINESVLVNTFENIPIAISNLAPGLSAELGGLQGSIRAQVSQSLIDQTNPEAIGLVIDGTNIRGPGNYTLPVTPVIPRGFIIFRYEPTELNVTIQGSEE